LLREILAEICRGPLANRAGVVCCISFLIEQRKYLMR